MTLSENIHKMQGDEDKRLPQLSRLMDDVLDQSPKDKIFIKNELKMKPLMEVSKHSFKDECGPLAIVNLELIQAAFRHFCEVSDGALTKYDLQTSSTIKNQWTDRYFVLLEDSNATKTDESDLDEDLKDLQIPDLDNNFSDLELSDLCNRQSFLESVYSTGHEECPESLLEPTPTQNVQIDVSVIPHLVDDGMTYDNQEINSDFEKQADNNSFNSNLPLAPSNNEIETGSYFAEDKCSPEKQSVSSLDSHPQSQQESIDLGNASLEVESLKQEILKKSVQGLQSSRLSSQSSRLISDEEILDYEPSDYDSEFSDPEFQNDHVPSPTLNNEYSFSENESSHTDKSSQNKHSDISPKVTKSREANVMSKEILLPAEIGNVDVSKDVDMRYGKKRPAAFSDDEDSNSDSEQSFKRRNKNSSPHQYRNLQAPFVNNAEMDVVCEQYFKKFDSVIEHIRSLCENHKIIDAINCANKYLEPSSRFDRLKIFKELILGVKKSACSSTNDVPEEHLRDIFDKLKSFMSSPEADNQDRRLISKIICEYFQHSLLIGHALDLCAFCQKYGIPINNQAVEAYAKNAMHRNAPASLLLSFLEYVKCVCQLRFPKSLLRHLLDRVMRGNQWYLLPEFSQLCDLLCRLEAFEVEQLPLQKFMEMCMDNECWVQIARLFVAWAGKGSFPTVLLQALLSRLKDAAMLYNNLAASVYVSGKDDGMAFFGLIGIYIILESHNRGLMEVENPKNQYLLNAHHVLCTLHKYGVDLVEVCNDGWKPTDMPDDIFDATYFSFNVVFTAVEICLLLECPKNAFQLFKDYSGKLSELPTFLSTSQKSRVRLKHFNLLLKVTKLLHDSDPLDTGLSAFRELVSTLEQETFLDELKESENVNFKAVENTFNDLLINCMNKSLLSNIYELYQYTYGPCQTILTFKSQVLRGLVETFARNQRLDDAHRLFLSGCLGNAYDELEKPQPGDLPPWTITISSQYTSNEMRFIIERFLRQLFPLLAEKPAKIRHEDWFTVKIIIKEFTCIPSNITCLIVTTATNTRARVCHVIKCIDPDFDYTEYEDHILLTPHHVYTYYCRNSANLKKNF